MLAKMAPMKILSGWNVVAARMYQNDKYLRDGGLPSNEDFTGVEGYEKGYFSTMGSCS